MDREHAPNKLKEIVIVTFVAFRVDDNEWKTFP